MERLAFVTEYLTEPLDEGSLKTASQLTRALSSKVTTLQIYARPSSAKEERFQNHTLPDNKLLLSRNLSMQFKRFKPEGVIYLPSSSGTLAGFLRGGILKLLSQNAMTGLIYLQPRSISSAHRVLAHISAVDIVFVQSRRSAQSLQESGFNTCWIPGGVDPSIFVPVDRERKHELRKKHGLPANSRIILHVGHLHRGRNIQELARLQSEGYFVLVVTSPRFHADGELRASLIQSGVHMISDYVARIEEVYQLADVYLFPTVQTTNAVETPLSVLEAMSCNIPVITTKFGSLPDIFQAGCGLFFYEDPDALPTLVEEAVNFPNCQTRDKIIHYTWDGMASQILARLEKRTS